jgi:rod shape-determining protein MreD
MRTLLVGLPLLSLAAVLQSTVLVSFRLLGGGFDLVLVMTLGWTLAGDWEGGMAWGFMGGVLLDLLSGGPLGGASLALVLMAYLASLSEGQFWRSHVLLPLATSLPGTFGFHVIYLAVLSFSGHPVDWASSLTQVTLPALFLNTLMIVPTYLVLRWLRALVYPVRVKA